MSLKKSLKTRAITAVLFGVVTIGLIGLHAWTYFTFIVLVCFLCNYEWAGMNHEETANPRIHLLQAVIALIPLFCIALNLDLRESFVLVLVILAGLNMLDPARSKSHLFTVGTGLFYITIPLILAYEVGFDDGEYHFERILYPLFLIWTNDVFAYLIGSMIGKNKLFPLVSPGKTWEGTIGGILLCAVVAMILGELWVKIPWTQAGIFGIAVGILATLGDLFESSLKRYFKVKDSGTMLPGHGGFLDRFDSFLLVMPFVWVLWKYFLS